MRVKVPKEIKIGALRADVGISDYIRVDDGYKGFFNQRTEELRLDINLTGGSRDTVFLHEIVHMISINSESGLSEEDTSRVANGFFEFLYYNLGIELDWSGIKEE